VFVLCVCVVCVFVRVLSVCFVCCVCVECLFCVLCVCVCLFVSGVEKPVKVQWKNQTLLNGVAEFQLLRFEPKSTSECDLDKIGFRKSKSECKTCKFLDSNS
jgi:hypothetical protein